jgi:hypothetical protein
MDALRYQTDPRYRRVVELAYEIKRLNSTMVEAVVELHNTNAAEEFGYPDLAALLADKFDMAREEAVELVEEADRLRLSRLFGKPG